MKEMSEHKWQMQMLPYGAQEWLGECENKRESYICSFRSHVLTAWHLGEIMEWQTSVVAATEKVKPGTTANNRERESSLH